MEVVVVPKRGLQKKIAVLAARYGSIDIEFTPPGASPQRTPAGVAHFLEHQLFKKPSGDMLAEFGKHGASSNAFTDYAVTAYYFTCTDAFDAGLDLLVDFVTHPHFTPENVDKERLIIEQELRMYREMPDTRCFQNLARALYGAHPVRHDIGGTVESIRDITAETLRSCYETFYRPSNLTLFLVGDFSAADALRRAMASAEKALGGRAAPPPGGRPSRSAPAEPPAPARTEARERMTASRPRVLIGFKDIRPSLRGEALLEQDLATSALLHLLFGKSSAAYNRWYEKGLIDDSFAFSFTSDVTYGFTLIGGETDEPERVHEEVRTAIRRARRELMRKRDVERLRRQALGRYLKSFDAPEGIAFLLLGCHFREADLFAWPRLVKRLSARRLEERLEEHLDEARSAVSYIFPEGKTA